MLIFYIYIFITFLCFAFSIENKFARQRFLYLYFFVVFTSEFLILLNIFDGSIYKYTKIFYICFFLFYFRKLLKFSRNLYILLLIILICFISKNIWGNETLLPLLQSLIYVFFSLEWLRLQINNPDETFIYNKQQFWICTGLLFWSTIFLMRIIPALFFAESDELFFSQINLVYQGITIFSYILFLKGLFCKQ